MIFFGSTSITNLWCVWYRKEIVNHQGIPDILGNHKSLQ